MLLMSSESTTLCMMQQMHDIVKTVVKNLFGSSVSIEMAKMQKQQSHSNNCGLFAIAIATAILFKDDPEKLVFKEQEMRQHLLQCFEKATMILFPRV